jgi:PQQ-dependent dehydrogenase (s-GDH family)
MEVQMNVSSRSLASLAILLLPALSVSLNAANDVVPPSAAAELGTGFSESILATGLEMPWEITIGPDKHLWTTERAGKRVSRIDLETGEKSVAVTIEDAFVGKQHEGVLGLALHPELGSGTNHDFIYVVYTYDSGTTGVVDDRRSKIVQFTWDANSSTLKEPIELVSGIPAGDDHNAGRIKFGPDGMLYYANGEQGHNQLANVCKPIGTQRLPSKGEVEAKDWSGYRGKILRIAADGSIPKDNPVINGVRSHVFTYGHRNPQGLVFGPNGELYSSEQGPSSDDEINLLTGGKNYGWPHVAGYQDDQSYTYINWSSVPDCDPKTAGGLKPKFGAPEAAETSWTNPDFVPPLKTFFTVPKGYPFSDASCPKDSNYICNPTIAPSSIDYYPSTGGIPGWENSLLVTSLKNGALYLVGLTADGKWVQGDGQKLFTSANRYRDLAISADGSTIYVATDTAGNVRDPVTGGVTNKLTNPGSILAFKYEKPQSN